jgi:tRNA(Phe) wybutosine-synthesizing methylase Tyw3
MADDNSNPILRHDQIQISAETQQSLNQPLKNDGTMIAIDPKDREFLKMIVEKVDKGEIKLYIPSSLINHAVYDNLDEATQGKADYDAFNLLTAIREIYNLWKAGDRESFQIIYQVHRMRLTKEHLEELGGDIYII